MKQATELSISEAARFVGIEPMNFALLTILGGVPYRRNDEGRWRYDRDELERWMDETEAQS